ncbi:MAG: hypothetical protein R3266_01850 [Gemmatimonadota bacterium]|nr:hypothetical protein [Gemmatimonadota bacterium]
MTSIGPLACLLALALPVAPLAAKQEPRPLEYLRLVDRADSLARSADFGGAAEVYGDALEVNPYDDGLWLRHARYSHRAGDLRTAAAAYERAIELGNDRRANTMVQLAALFAEMGEDEEVFTWLERALAEPLETRPRLAEMSQFERYRDDARFRALAGIFGEFPDRVAGWRADLAWLVQEAKRLHAGLDRPAHSAAFDRAAAELDGRIPELDDEAVALELQRLIVLLGDGHSAVWSVPTERVPFRSLPIDLYAFSDGVFVVGAADAELVGRELVSMGGLPVDTLLRRTHPFISRDNPMGLRASAPGYLTRMAVLRELGAAPDLEAAEIELRASDGTTETVRLSAGPRRPFWRPRPPPGGGAPPRWLRDGPTIWMEEGIAPGVVYVQFRAVANPEGSSIEAFADSLHDVLDRSDSDAVILDVRRNGGGNNFLNAPLVTALIRFQADRADRRIYVLTSRHTFSAAQNFVNQVRRWTYPTFVGEPTGSRPNFAGETTPVHMPFSGLRASISSRYWQDSHATDSRIWIAPDIPVELDSQAYFGNRDPVLTAALDHVMSSRSPRR